jgi:hypothetical protein
LLFAVLIFVLQIPAVSCGDAAECRRMATEAAARGDAEAFHDLAWRAVQKGKPNDPALMFLLARAQSLSGRPGDALVMLTRIVDLGTAPDVASDPDFARVRALAGWPSLEARIAGRPAPPAPAAPPPSSAPPTRPATPAAAAAPPAAAAAPSAPSGDLNFSAPGLDPFALAHDAVSRRFVLGDRRGHRLLIVDEVSHNVVNFVGAASAGFLGELTGFTIDARRGDLWVVSAEGEEAAAVSALHKLQLVSGRSLITVRAPERTGAVRFVAVAVLPDGTVYALDARGSRLFRLRAGAGALELVMKVDATGATALAAADDRTVYVAADKGLFRIDLAARAAVRVATADDLGGFESLAWRAGSLVGVARIARGYVVARVKLDPSGTRARPRQILAESPASAVGAVAGDSFYYLSGQQTIRRLKLNP